jgi:hypothetical protein
LETTLIDLTRMMALKTKLDVTANNVANLETTGFRAQQLSFQEFLAPVMGQEVGAKRERPLSLVHATFAFTTTAAGAVQTTGNPLNFAIDGDAYFAVRTDQGERYTRDEGNEKKGFSGSRHCLRTTLWHSLWIFIVCRYGRARRTELRVSRMCERVTWIV